MVGERHIARTGRRHAPGVLGKQRHTGSDRGCVAITRYVTPFGHKVVEQCARITWSGRRFWEQLVAGEVAKRRQWEYRAPLATTKPDGG
jgi:hypothetical protein